MRDLRSGDGVVGKRYTGERPESRAQEIVSLLDSPVFVDMRPGHVRVNCRGFTGVGPDRESAFRALGEQVKEVKSVSVS